MRYLVNGRPAIAKLAVVQGRLYCLKVLTMAILTRATLTMAVLPPRAVNPNPSLRPSSNHTLNQVRAEKDVKAGTSGRFFDVDSPLRRDMELVWRWLLIWLGLGLG